jgi:hypothetical protein
MQHGQVLFSGRRDTTAATLVLLAALATGCGDNLGAAPLDAPLTTPDALSLPDAAGSPGRDGSMRIDAALGTDASPDEPWPPSNIDLARAESDGPVDIQINRVFVTYLKPDVVSEPAGFFIQSHQSGPALFIAVAPSSLFPEPEVGDLVSFRIREMDTDDYQRRARQVSDFVRHAQGALPTLVQNVSAASDLVSALEDYESELISARATISTDFRPIDLYHSYAQAETSGITNNVRLVFSLPNALQNEIHLVEGCVIDIERTPLWRYRGEAQLHAWERRDIAAADCPPTSVTDAIAVNPTQVRVVFDRAIDPGSISDATNQFLFDGGLEVQSASVTGTTIILTTGTQEEGRLYRLTVASTVTDVLAAPINDNARTVEFLGFMPPAEIQINEIKANVPGGCDLLELRVIIGGSLDGVQILERTQSILTFRNLIMEGGEIIVMHSAPIESSCNPGGSGNEITGPTEQPASAFPGNFDSAYDWYASTALSLLPNVITVVDVNGAVLDGVLFTTSATNDAIPEESEIQAAALVSAKAWEMVGGGVPAGGFVGLDFSAHAAEGLMASGSIARVDDNDDDNESDWVVTSESTISFGALNPGQGPVVSHCRRSAGRC